MSQKFVVPEQDAIEVFVNDVGSISIRVYDRTEGDINIIVIQPVFVDLLIRALRAAKREANDMNAQVGKGGDVKEI